MDLIAQVIGGVLAFFAGIIGNILAHDICASANSICAKIIKVAAARLAPFDRDSTEQQWLADLQEHLTITEKYRHVVGCFLAAPKMRRYSLEAPFVAEAPGLVWKKRRKSISEARWQSSLKAIEEGYIVKSVKLWSGNKTELTADQKDFIIATTLDLQAEHDRWLYDPSYRMQHEAEAAERKRQIQELIALGHTRAEAADAVYFSKSEKRQERPG